jgi:hypothetical protein
MATAPEAVRSQLAVVTATASADLAAVAAQSRRPVDAALEALGLVVPSYYDAAGALAVAWYDERRSESSPSTSYVPEIIGDPATDWIEREVSKFADTLDADLEDATQRLLNEALTLAEKEVARGFRDSILGNSRMDEDSIGWSRVARPGACKFCTMLADKGAVYSEASVDFAAHGNCNCATRPEFRNGDHGPEASVIQYVASSKRSSDPAVQAARNARVREYLNHNYPDLPG